MTVIRPMTAADWEAVQAIYRDGIATGDATFEADPPSWEQFDASRAEHPRLVAVDDADAILGWAAASPVSARVVCGGVVEHSIYVAPDTRGTGVGKRLLRAFLDAAESAGIWTVQSSIFRENLASLRLHEHAGFRVVGHRERIALMSYGPHAGEWRDTMLIEWRSARTGTG